MERLCDLHTHTYFSDGTLSPAQLVALAQKEGIGVLALTDHNTVAGLPHFLQAGQGSGIELVPGIEFSTHYGEVELHIVALFVPESAYPAITQLMEEGERIKEQSNLDLLQALEKDGFLLDYDQVKAMGKGRINRAHIASALTQAGYCASVKEAFSRLLNPSCGYYHPPRMPDSLRIIGFIRQFGGLSVLAHPYLSLKTQDRIEEFLQKAVPAGLMAMETEYSSHTPEQTLQARCIADRFGLLHSGGSDFHGDPKPDIRLGVGRGTLQVSRQLYEMLKSANLKK